MARLLLWSFDKFANKRFQMKKEYLLVSIPLFIVCFLLVIRPVLSQTNEIGEWFCIEASNIETFTFQQDGVILNNFNFSERGSWSSNIFRVIEFSYSAINRNNIPVNLNIQLVGIDTNGSPVLALQADPMLDIVSDNSNELVEVDSYIVGSAINQMADVCMIVLLD